MLCIDPLWQNAPLKCLENNCFLFPSPHTSLPDLRRVMCHVSCKYLMSYYTCCYDLPSITQCMKDEWLTKGRISRHNYIWWHFFKGFALLFLFNWSPDSYPFAVTGSLVLCKANCGRSCERQEKHQMVGFWDANYWLLALCPKKLLLCGLRLWALWLFFFFLLFQLIQKTILNSAHNLSWPDLSFVLNYF